MLHTVVVTLLAVCTIWATIGNFLIILTPFLYRRMRSMANLLLTSLATADLLISVLVVPAALADLSHGHRWPLGRLLCQMWTTADVCLCTASILNLCVISLDRYVAVTNPLSYARRKSVKCLCGLIFGVWSTSAALCIPPLIVPAWQSEMVSGDTCRYVKAVPFRIYSALGSFYIPLIVMLIVYVKIYRVVSRRENQIIEQGSIDCASQGSKNGKHKTSGLRVWKSGREGGSSMSCRSNKIQCTMTPTSGRTTGQCSPRKYSGPPTINLRGSVPARRRRQGSVIPPPLARHSTDLMLIGQTAKRSSSFSKEVTFSESVQRKILKAAEDPSSRQGGSLSNIEMMAREKHYSVLLDHMSKQNDKTKRLDSLATDGKPWTGTSSPSSSGYHGFFGAQGSKLREKLLYLKERKAIKTISIVVCGFVGCWLPFFSLYIAELLCDLYSGGPSQMVPQKCNSTTTLASHPASYDLKWLTTTPQRTNLELCGVSEEFTTKSTCEIPSILPDLFLWLGYANSALNPLIYTFYNKDYRRCFKDILSLGFLRTQLNRRPSVRRLHQSVM